METHVLVTSLQLMRWAQMHQIPLRMEQQGFEDFVSVAGKSTPGPGSQTRPIKQLRWNLIFQDITRLTVHDSGDITVHTPNGNCRFWKKPEARDE